MTRQPGHLRRGGQAGARRCGRRGQPAEAMDGVTWPTTWCTRWRPTTSRRRTPTRPSTSGSAAAEPASSRSSTSAASVSTTASCRHTCARGGRSNNCWPLAGVPVTVLRAAVVVGHGGISWEITRQLVDHLPVMITPKWVTPAPSRSRCGMSSATSSACSATGQRSAGCSKSAGRKCCATSTCSSGRQGPGQEACLSCTVPLLTPRLSSTWLALVTDVDYATARNLVDSMTNEVVVPDHSIEQIVPFATMSYEDAVRLALEERAERAVTGRRRSNAWSRRR